MGNLQSSASKNGSKGEEIVIISNVQDMAKQFVKENIIIWHDPDINSQENKEYINSIASICNEIRTFPSWEEAYTYIKQIEILCQVITSGTNGELFVNKISELPNVCSIYIFCGNVTSHQEWAGKYPKILCVENQFDALLSKIKQSVISWQREKSSLRVDLPAFAPIFNDIDKSQNNYLHLNLKGLSSFTNREQSKRDFLALARAIFHHDKDFINEFEKNYNKYDMKSILHWYTRECFLYKITNNCLRISTSDSILYCRLILKDLESAIKEQYQKESYKFNGLLYRGAYVSDQEWDSLQKNTGKDIEMYGFLSTTKTKQVALAFAQGDILKKALITIVVPAAPDRGKQGFAELAQFSDFPGEEEVLFNVRSRFTVLETGIEEESGFKYRHIVLFYGSQAIRKYMKLQKPVVNIQISNDKMVKCVFCNLELKCFDESRAFVDLSKTNRFICKGCLQESSEINNDVPLLCLFPFQASSSDSIDKKMNLKVEGFVMKYKNSLDLAFYGYKCNKCGKSKLNGFYKCISCHQPSSIYCEACCDLDHRCIQNEHLLVLERKPFTFWSQKMTAHEWSHLEYQDMLSNLNTPIFQQAQTYFETHNYAKAEKFYLKFLEKNSATNSKNSGLAYNHLGNAYYKMGQYEKAMSAHSKALDIWRALYGEKHIMFAFSYNGIGLALESLGLYQKSLESHQKALEIKLSVYNTSNLDIAESYNNVGLVHYKVGHFEKAIECYLNSIQIKESIYEGKQYPEIATSYSNLGLVYSRVGQHEKAFETQMKALEIKKTIYGDHHPETANSYNNLGIVYFELGEFEKAIEVYNKALDIKILINGEEHPGTANSYNNIALVYENLGKYKEALEFYVKALKIKKIAYGEQHSDTAAIYVNLGIIHGKLNEYEKSVEYHTKALEIRKSIFGERHPDTLDAKKNLDLVKQLQATNC